MHNRTHSEIHSEITLRHCYPGYQRFNFSRAAGIFGVGRRPRKVSGTHGTALPEILKSKVEDRNLIYSIQPTQKFNRDLYKLLTHNFRWVFIVLPGEPQKVSILAGVSLLFVCLFFQRLIANLASSCAAVLG